jgi:hypothetical protein
MTNANRLTEQQKQFLRKMRDELILLPELLKEMNIKPSLLARWLRRRFFLETKSEIVREMRLQYWIDLELLARAAQAMLREMITGARPRDEVLVMLCRVILEHYERMLRWRARRRKNRIAKAPSEERDLCHPRFKHREAELLALMEAAKAGR